MTDAPAATKPWPARHPCAFAALGCALILILTSGLVWWGCTAHWRRRDEQFAEAIRRALDPTPLSFAPDSVAPVIVHGSYSQNFEVARDDLAQVKTALAPLGEVKSVTLLSVGQRDPIAPLPVRCRVEGTRATRDVTFTFEARDLPIAVWWGLRSAELE